MLRLIDTHRHSKILMSLSFRVRYGDILISTFCEGLEQFVDDAFGFNVARIACRHFMRHVTHSSALRYLYVVHVLRYTLHATRISALLWFFFACPNLNTTLASATSGPICYGACCFVFNSWLSHGESQWVTGSLSYLLAQLRSVWLEAR